MNRKHKRIHSNKPLSYRQQLLKEFKEKYPYYNFKSNLLAGIFIIGVSLTVWEINIYRETFIPLYTTLSIWILPSLITTPLFKKTFNIYCFNPYSPGRTGLFWHYFYNIASFGGILLFLFMWTNQNFTDHKKNVLTTSITKYGHLAKSSRSCGDPYVHINYMNNEKELVFPCGTEIEKYNTVFIEVEKGFFGFDIITNKTLIKGQW